MVTTSLLPIVDDPRAGKVISPMGGTAAGSARRHLACMSLLPTGCRITSSKGSALIEAEYIEDV